MAERITARKRQAMEMRRRIQETALDLKPFVLYTTRPIREGETDGVEYFFTDREELEKQEAAGKVIEERTYQTVAGPWTYYTVDDGQFDVVGDASCLMIGTLESYEKMCAYFEDGKMVPVYIEVPDGVRLMRAVKREENQKNPNYREVCRRYLADEKDFSEENLERLGIAKKYQNTDIGTCVEEILRDLDK